MLKHYFVQSQKVLGEFCFNTMVRTEQRTHFSGRAGSMDAIDEVEEPIGVPGNEPL